MMDKECKKQCTDKEWMTCREDTVGMVDDIDIKSADMDIRGYEWEINGKTGKAAYLQAINIIQNIDRFGAEYMEQNIQF